MILSCGEALIDMLPRETTRGEESFAPYAGGALFNTAIALGRQGIETGFISGLSTDLFGDQLRAKLHESRVTTDLSVVSSHPTTLAFVRLIDGQATYTFYDQNTALRLLTPADIPAIPEHVSTMVFGCISLVGEPCASFFEALMSENAADRVMMIDPNIRPSFIDNPAPYRARLERMMAISDIIKLSDEDLHWLMGDGEIEALSHELLSKGAKLVCITQGADGVAGFSADHSVFVPATKVDVVDTVGAGDTFNGGLLRALSDAGLLTKSGIANLGKDAITQALSMGARSAAITVSRAGANPPWAHEL